MGFKDGQGNGVLGKVLSHGQMIDVDDVWVESGDEAVDISISLERVEL